MLKRKDKRGDVKRHKRKGISKADRRSIDIISASVTVLANKKVRYKVRIKKYRKTKKFDQMVFFMSQDPKRKQYGFPVVNTNAGFKTRNSGGAYAYDSLEEQSCNLKVKRKKNTFWVDVPYRCAPYGDDRITVSTAAGMYQTDEAIYSEDSLVLGKMTWPDND